MKNQHPVRIITKIYLSSSMRQLCGSERVKDFNFCVKAAACLLHHDNRALYCEVENRPMCSSTLAWPHHSHHESAGLLPKQHRKDSDYFLEKLTEHDEVVLLGLATSVSKNKCWVKALRLRNPDLSFLWSGIYVSFILTWRISSAFRDACFVIFLPTVTWEDYYHINICQLELGLKGVGQGLKCW